ncbi:MAG: tRNA (adenosine(37)-N6)-threonylcarbamoyltransferase complex transferase subunit TsaD [Trueperaceae bacterium]|nr:tRNA (adenosine(37)-N6)-threonylcarbamoyltransferase complex transferase subunit TsaD [Trueperaceae bacterium]
MSLILGVDTSCDDTGIGLVRDGAVVANVVAAQTALHAKYGGVMPEQASREHLSVIDRVLDDALSEAGASLDDVTAVAATYGPGLVGALLVGLTYAKGLAWARGVPFVPIHHLEGHLASSLAADLAVGGGLEPPFLCLIASGGHTSLFDVVAWGDYRELGKSRDDAAGEAFDKVARLLGLGYPGGPALSKAAVDGDPQAFDLPLPLRQQEGFDFSFSGLKTAVSLTVEKNPDLNRADLAASFERVVVDSLFRVTERAARATGRHTVVVAGGVAANRPLRARFAASDLRAVFPPPALATDNGAMIALAAWLRQPFADSDWGRDAAPYVPLASDKRDTARS